MRTVALIVAASMLEFASAYAGLGSMGSMSLRAACSSAAACAPSRAGVVAAGMPGSSSSRSRKPLSAMRMCEAAVEEECEGPAKEGVVGDVDTTKAKAAAGDIKTEGIISLSPAALKQVNTLRASRGSDLVLRVGVRSGGCSGMSYVMEFEDTSKIEKGDTELDFEGVKIVVDPKSLMFIFGMTLDYSDDLIGGGFKFQNPNADSTCGCGQSFGT